MLEKKKDNYFDYEDYNHIPKAPFLTIVSSMFLMILGIIALILCFVLKK